MGELGACFSRLAFALAAYLFVGSTGSKSDGSSSSQSQLLISMTKLPSVRLLRRRACISDSAPLFPMVFPFSCSRSRCSFVLKEFASTCTRVLGGWGGSVKAEEERAASGFQPPRAAQLSYRAAQLPYQALASGFSASFSSLARRNFPILRSRDDCPLLFHARGPTSLRSAR